MPRDDEKMLRLLAREVCRLGAATQERKTRFCRVALPLHPTYYLRAEFVGWVRRRRSETQRPLHPTYAYVLSGCAAAPPDLLLKQFALLLAGRSLRASR